MGYTFRLASSRRQRRDLIAFLATHWAKKPHLPKSEELFLWQYHEPGTVGSTSCSTVDKSQPERN